LALVQSEFAMAIVAGRSPLTPGQGSPSQ
jgi:hypothetical protein